jgi:hypothetical protein
VNIVSGYSVEHHKRMFVFSASLYLINNVIMKREELILKNLQVVLDAIYKEIKQT